MSELTTETKQSAPDESLVCEECGRFGALEFGDRKLCPDCYAGSGSCCPEFGRKESCLDIPESQHERSSSTQP
jgi:hypothetical protein